MSPCGGIPSSARWASPTGMGHALRSKRKSGRLNADGRGRTGSTAPSQRLSAQGGGVHQPTQAGTGSRDKEKVRSEVDWKHKSIMTGHGIVRLAVSREAGSRPWREHPQGGMFRHRHHHSMGVVHHRSENRPGFVGITGHGIVVCEEHYNLVLSFPRENASRSFRNLTFRLESSYERESRMYALQRTQNYDFSARSGTLRGTQERQPDTSIPSFILGAGVCAGTSHSIIVSPSEGETR